MGYTTDFEGQFDVTPVLNEEHLIYLQKFSETRRMTRKVGILATFANDQERIKVGLPLGVDGEFYVGGKGLCGQDQDESQPDHNYYCNTPPGDQPSLWCDWTPNEFGNAIEWNGGEKFYNYVEWIEYMIEKFFKPWGYKLNGEVFWFGENPDDRGKIIIEYNEVLVKKAKIIFE